MIKRVVVAGCRNYNNYAEAKEYIDFCISDLRDKYDIVFISGCCKGADMLGERYAAENSFPVERYPAKWKKHGKYAGPIRNQKMAERSDYVICLWDGKSRGTRSMIDSAKRVGKPLRIKMI